MPDGRRRSREHWTDTMEAGPPDPPSHIHRLPGAVRVALIGLAAAVLLLAVALGLMAVFVYQANQYVQGRGEFRDAEATRMEQRGDEQIRQAMCDLLDQLPEGGLLDRPRAKYGCGPGIPLADLPPEQREQLRNQRATPAPSSPASRPRPVAPESAAPIPAPEAAPAPSPASPPSTSSEPPPLVNLGPLTGPVCDSVRVCF